MDKILLTICARGGSKGVKGKNIRQVRGKPLIAYTIKQAVKWGKAARIVVSTDSKEIADVAKQFGAEAPFIRPQELATDKSGKIEVLRHALEEAEKYYGEKYSAIIDLDVTAPVRKLSDIDGAYELFLKKDALTVFSATPARKNPYFNMVETDADGKARLCKVPGCGVIRRQDAPKVYDMNASIYIYKREYLADRSNLSAISERSFVWVMDEVSAMDIDTETNLKYLEFLIEKGAVKL